MQSPNAVAHGRESRPKGILKNPSYDLGAASNSVSPPKYAPSAALATPSLDSPENKEITLQNTLQNAGPRRASSNQGRRLSAARRQNSTDETNQRLKWDEANLYLTEQDRTSTMKITEPKTPYAPHYDPAEDEAEQLAEEAKEAAMDAGDIVVDELDGKKKGKTIDKTKMDDIPGLELGEPEEAVSGGFDLDERDRIIRERSYSNGSNKHVDVAAAEGHDGEDMSEKHKDFEKKRKMHYEMGNVKDILGHPEELDVMDEDDEEPARSVPPVPGVPSNLQNGS